MKIEIKGKVFDSDFGELTLGDMEELERRGIDLGNISPDGRMSINTLKALALVCLRAADPTVDENFVASIPTRQTKDVGEYIRAFFERAFPTKEGG